MTVNHGVPGSSPGGGAKKNPIRPAILRGKSGFFVDSIFHLHTICTKIPLPQFCGTVTKGLRRARTSAARCEKPTFGRQTRTKKREISERPFYSFASLRLCENKKEKNKVRKVGKAPAILRGRLQRRGIFPFPSACLQ